MFPFYVVMLFYDTTSLFSKDDKGKSSISKNYSPLGTRFDKKIGNFLSCLAF